MFFTWKSSAKAPDLPQTDDGKPGRSDAGQSQEFRLQSEKATVPEPCTTATFRAGPQNAVLTNRTEPVLAGPIRTWIGSASWQTPPGLRFSPLLPGSQKAVNSPFVISRPYGWLPSTWTLALRQLSAPMPRKFPLQPLLFSIPGLKLRWHVCQSDEET